MTEVTIYRIKDFKIIDGVLKKYLVADKTIVEGNLIIPKSVKVIAKGVFSKCILHQVTFPEGLEIIEDEAFNVRELYYGHRFREAILPEGVKKVGRKAFFGCGCLEKIHIPASLTEIGESAFGNCGAYLGEITVAEDNPRYYVQNGCLIDRQTKTIICGCYHATIPDDGSVEEIGPYALGTTLCGSCSDNYNAWDYKQLVIPDGVIKISEGAFNYRKPLQKVIISSDVKTIGDRAFSHCYNLTEVTLSEGLECIGDEAFAYASISNIFMPMSVQTIGRCIFFAQDREKVKNINIFCNVKKRPKGWDRKWSEGGYSAAVVNPVWAGEWEVTES